MFVDTNVLVYARFPGSQYHDAARAGLERALQDGDALSISRQILREYLSTVTRPQAWSDALNREEALEEID